jgi:MEMO1 family protein
MITFAALCPHPPLSIPAIGQTNLAGLSTTINSFQKLNTKLLATKPDTLVVISPSHKKTDEDFVINAAPKYLGSLENFGDLATRMEFSADLDLLAIIQKYPGNSDTTFIPEEKIDYGATIPLYHLTRDLIGTKLIVIYPPAKASLEDILRFGKLLQKIFKESEKKIAVVASGDLSHKLTDDSPIGVSPRAKEFDHTLIKMLKHKKIAEVLAIEPELSAEAEECALGPIVTLLGILYRVPYTPKILSYEHPFGIGYLTMEMELK